LNEKTVASRAQFCRDAKFIVLFSPANISVRKGEKVTLRIIGEEGVHGFAVPELSINKTIRLGEVITVDLPTGTAGLYRFFCSVQCGQGHIDMNGEIIIEP